MPTTYNQQSNNPSGARPQTTYANTSATGATEPGGTRPTGGGTDDYYQDHNDEEVAAKSPQNFTGRLANFFSQDLPLMFLRLTELAASAIVLGLMAYSRRSYGVHNGKNNFVIAVSVISLFYLLMLYAILFALRMIMVPGIFFIYEIILMLLWLAAFIVVAWEHGRSSCSVTDFGNGTYYNNYLGSLTTQTYGRACRSSKTAIAFAGLAWLLFTISTFLFWKNVIRPIRKDQYKGFSDIWKSGSVMNINLHRMSGLKLADYTPPSAQTGHDLEHGGTGTYDNAYATQGGAGAGAGAGAGGAGGATGATDEERYNTYGSSNNNSTLQSGSNHYNEKHERKPSSGTQPYSAADTNAIPEEEQVGDASRNQQNPATTTTTTTQYQEQKY
ncbi:putative membrane protein [Hanseniaspora osmophila]|uniref:Putative membrane protein n=1 Tax=Hanseniaspora osmophila TaxID=56408 RepID=A0A1E5RN09_9ASCO|nr:putative membrane protein [Hanseniaspora osmophila]